MDELTTDSFVLASPGNDTIIDTAAFAYIVGGPGNDLLVGIGTMDEIVAGPGNDTLVGGSELTQMFGGPGRDLFVLTGGGLANISGYHAGDRIQAPHRSHLVYNGPDTEVVLDKHLIGYVDHARVAAHDLIFA